MIRRVVAIVSGALTVVALAVPAGAQARPYLFFGGGGTVPMGDYGDYAKAGWMIQAGIGTNLGDKGLWGDVEFLYGSNSHDTDGDKTNLTIGAVSLGYTFQPEAKMSPYVLGTVGMMNHAYKSESVPSAEGSESFLAFGGALGLVWQRSDKTSFWAEVRYMTGSKDGSSTSFVPIFVGITRNLR